MLRFHLLTAAALALASSLYIAAGEASQCGSDASCPTSTTTEDDLSSAVQLRSNLGRGAWSDWDKEEKKKPAKTCFYKKGVRVRREWRMLSESRRKDVARAFWTMQNTSTEEGREKFGPYFVNYDEIVAQHACAVFDPRCDQGHVGPQFMTFHRLLLLKMELALLAVDPSIEALPYWDISLDSVGGKYYKDPETWIFSDNFFGSYWGKGPNYEVNDGLFANWPIPEWTRERMGADSRMAKDSFCIRSEFFSGMKSTTCPSCCGKGETCTCPKGEKVPTWMRNHPDCAPHVARQPNDKAGPQGFFKLGGTYDLIYRQKDFDACDKYPENVRSWMDWQNCQSLSFIFCEGSPSVNSKKLAGDPEFVNSLKDDVFPEVAAQLEREDPLEAEAKFMAAAMNRMMGHLGSNDTAKVASAIEQTCNMPMIYGYYKQAKTGKHKYPYMHHGHAHNKMGRDFLDVATSTNDAASFSGHHTNIDRSNMQFQVNSLRKDPSLEKQLWYYPKSQFEIQANSSLKTGMSGPWSTAAALSCAPLPKRYRFYSQFPNPWTSGTLASEVVSSGFPFVDLFNASCDGENDCSGRKLGGYTHQEVLKMTAPRHIPYTYDSLEHLICDE